MTDLVRHDIVAETDAQMRETGAYVAPHAQIVRATHLGETVFFTVDNPRDVIQSEHLAGRFYELEELAIIQRYFPLGGRFLDIGANVGNHSVYLAKFLRASRVAMVEPNPLAIPLLQANIFLNGLEAVCERGYLGYGLSDGAVETATIRTGNNNLGGARVKEGAGDVPLRTGDALFGDQAFDLIKIDVEGMEMKVLAGMRSYLAARPTRIFIEVDKVNYDAFDEWIGANGYRVLEEFQRYPTNKNFMIEPGA
ncbi:FkbM family methyltransferase [Roseovarius sp. C7]|uniref:FkbM family methyltransferase n=1 Tax=Roseovarius sp. C7 TaxID=3398643 RepID=UPI0039F46470